jgi:hypothetical protein
MIADRNEQGTWCASCGNKGCDGTLRLLNLSFVVTGDSLCDSCKAGGLLEDVEDGVSVGSELGWCGCVDDDRVDRLMFEYLDRVERTNASAAASGASFAEKAIRASMPMFAGLLFSKPPAPDEPQIEDDVSAIMAQLADDLGWTEHGTSIRYVWLTGGGKAALKVLRTWAETAAEAGDEGAEK